MQPGSNPRVHQVLQAACVLVLVWMAVQDTVFADPGLIINIPAVYKNHPTPTPTIPPGRLVISEVLVDAEIEPEGEWIELYNAGGISISTMNYKIGDAEKRHDEEGMFTFPVDAQLEPGQALVVAYQAAFFLDLYGLKPDYELYDSNPEVPDMIKYTAWSGGSLSLNNAGDELILLDPADQWADAVSWGSSTIAFDPPVHIVSEGHSLARYPADQDTDSNYDWIDQPTPDPKSVRPIPPKTATPTRTATAAATYLYTPTAVHTSTATSTPTPSEQPVLIINEIHADPDNLQGDANQDNVVDLLQDEFIEIVNISGHPVDLSGWQIRDNVTTRHIFPDSSLLADQCAAVVFGGGNLPGNYGSSMAQTASSGLLSLTNSGDRIILVAPGDQLFITQEYGIEASYDQSVVRNPDIYGPPPLVQHSTIPEAGGRLFSAGIQLDGAQFQGCSQSNQENPTLLWMIYDGVCRLAGICR